MTDDQIIDEFKAMGSFLSDFIGHLPTAKDNPGIIDPAVFSQATSTEVSVEEHVFIRPTGSSKDVEVMAKFDPDSNKIVIGRAWWKNESRRIEMFKIALHEYLRATRGKMDDDNYGFSGPFIKTYGEHLLNGSRPVKSCLSQVLFHIDGVQFSTGAKITGTLTATKTIPVKPFAMLKQWFDLSQMSEAPKFFAGALDNVQLTGSTQALKKIANQLDPQIDLTVEPSPMGRVRSFKAASSVGKVSEQTSDQTYRATVDFDPVDFSDLSCPQCSQGNYRPSIELRVDCE